VPPVITTTPSLPWRIMSAFQLWSLQSVDFYADRWYYCLSCYAKTNGWLFRFNVLLFYGTLLGAVKVYYNCSLFCCIVDTRYTSSIRVSAAFCSRSITKGWRWNQLRNGGVPIAISNSRTDGLGKNTVNHMHDRTTCQLWLLLVRALWLHLRSNWEHI